ncbi:MAG: Na+/H+ antiporter NhaC, partial [Tissierellia bacterium]|nr:Na+/H+ antiporter NhaC [Tissierellia bacterium]
MNSDEKMEKVGKSINSSRKPISFVYAMLVIVVVFGFVAIGLLIYDSPLELMFLLSWVITAPLVMTLGYTYEEVQNMAWESAKQSFEPNVILVV